MRTGTGQKKLPKQNVLSPHFKEKLRKAGWEMDLKTDAKGKKRQRGVLGKPPPSGKEVYRNANRKNKRAIFRKS